jgi:hypothetical protein
MKGLVTTSFFDAGMSDIPISLPQTEVRAGDSLVVCSVKLLLGQELRLGYVAAQLVKISPGTATKINTSLGLVYVGIFAGGFDTLRTQSGTPVNYLSFSGPRVSVLSPYNQRNFLGPDVVEVVVVNNTSNLSMDLSVIGAARLFIYA